MTHKNSLKDYRVTFEDGSTVVIEIATGKTEARQQANKWLADYCGYDGLPHSPRRPKIMKIEAIQN